MELTSGQKEWMKRHLSTDRAELVAKVIAVCKDDQELQEVIKMGQFLSENRQILDRIAIESREI